jgi:hypothetical protein
MQDEALSFWDGTSRLRRRGVIGGLLGRLVDSSAEGSPNSDMSTSPSACRPALNTFSLFDLRVRLDEDEGSSSTPGASEEFRLRGMEGAPEGGWSGEERSMTGGLCLCGVRIGDSGRVVFDEAVGEPSSASMGMITADA